MEEVSRNIQIYETNTNHKIKEVENKLSLIHI